MKKNILIVDDEPDIISFLERGLAQNGYATQSCQNGAEALQILEDSHVDNEVHLIISDIQMPVMDGIALALNIARDMPHIPLILMTGYAHQRERASSLKHNGLDSLVVGIVEKPFELTILVKLIEQNI